MPKVFYSFEKKSWAVQYRNQLWYFKSRQDALKYAAKFS